MTEENDLNLPKMKLSVDDDNVMTVKMSVNQLQYQSIKAWNDREELIEEMLSLLNAIDDEFDLCFFCGMSIMEMPGHKDGCRFILMKTKLEVIVLP